MISRILVYYIFSFIFTILLGGLQELTGFFPNLILPQWGPGLAAILMLLLFRKDHLTIRFEFKRSQIKAYLGSILYPVIITGIAIAATIWLLHDLDTGQLTYYPGIIVIGSTLFGAVGEEIGWRGYLQPTLNKKMSLFWTSLIVGVLWAAWHVNNFSNGPLFILGFFLVILGYSFFISYLSKDSKFNLVMAVLFHWFVNLANSVVPGDTLTAGRFMLTMGIVWTAAVILLVISQRTAFRGKA